MSLRTHFTWSIEGPNNTCPTCGGPTVLALPFTSWSIDEDEGEVTVEDEVSGHYCCACGKLVSLSFNSVK